MLFKTRFIETSDRADFYFDPLTKIITKEYSQDYIGISLKGEHQSKYYLLNAYPILERAAIEGKFDHCKTFDDLAKVNV